MIGKNIKALRNHLKMTQTRFAETIGIRGPSLSAIESEQNTATNRLLTTICAVHGVNRLWLETGTGPMFSDAPRQFFREFGDWMNGFLDTVRTILNEKTTIIEVSKHTGVSQETLYQWQRDGFPQPILDIVALAKYLGVSVDELLKGRAKTGRPDTLGMLKARLVKYNVDTLPDNEVARLLDMVEILVGILTSTDETTKTSICNNLKSFRELVSLKTGREIEVGNNSDPPDKPARADPSSSGKTKNTSLGGTRDK